MGVKSLPKFERPREKLERYGAAKLSESELFSVILGSGVRGTDVMTLSKNIVKVKLKTAPEALTLEKLKSIKGLGKSKSMQIIAALEIGRRKESGPEIMLSPKKIFELCSDFRDSKKEHLIAFYLNAAQGLVAREIISIGILDSSLLHPREVFEPALRLAAASVILVHNHPSGSTSASEADKDMTKTLIHAGKILGILLSDHLIVTNREYSSILDQYEH